MSQDDVSDKLGITGEFRRRTMTRYEKGNRNPKDERTKELSKYEYKELNDYIYTFMWLEELLSNYHIDLSSVPNINEKIIVILKKLLLNGMLLGIREQNEKSVMKNIWSGN